jgi:hypothetical protein
MNSNKYILEQPDYGSMHLKCSRVFFILIILLGFTGCSIITGDVNMEGILTITPEEVELGVGEQTSFEYDIIQSPSEPKLQIQWRLAPEDIAEFDEYRSLTALGIGEVFVIAEAFDKNGDLVTSDSSRVRITHQYVNINGDLRSIAKVIKDERLFVTGFDPALRFSDDGGVQWQIASGINPSYQLNELNRSVIDPERIATNYYDQDFSTTSIQSVGMLVSEDNGESWVKTAPPIPPGSGAELGWVYDVKFSNVDANTLYVLSSVNREPLVLKSTDLGNSWSSLASFELHTSSNPNLFIDPVDEDVIYVSAAGQVSWSGGVVSKDGGQSWTQWGITATETVFDITDSGMLLGRAFAGNSTYSEEQIVGSVDQASSWQVLLEPDSDVDYVDVNAFGDDCIAVLTRNKQIIVSTDRGENWQAFDLIRNDQIGTNWVTGFRMVSCEEEKAEFLVLWANYLVKHGIFMD